MRIFEERSDATKRLMVKSAAGAERIRARFAEAAGLPPVTLSAGVSAAVSPEDGALLIAESDAALYAAKRAGRDRTVVRSATPV